MKEKKYRTEHSKKCFVHVHTDYDVCNMLLPRMSLKLCVSSLIAYLIYMQLVNMIRLASGLIG